MQQESWTADAMLAPTGVTIGDGLADLLTMPPLGTELVVEGKWSSINGHAVLDYEDGYEDDTDFEDEDDQSDDGDDDDLDEDDDYELETDDDFDDETELDDDLDEDVFDDDDDDLDDLDDD